MVIESFPDQTTSVIHSDDIHSNSAQSVGLKSRGPKSLVQTRTLHLVLPAYNEEDSLRPLFERLRRTELPIHLKAWVIDDGSIDQTAAIASEGLEGLDVQLVKHPVNQGLGRAVQTGIRAALRVASSDDIIAIMDADNTHDPALLDAMITAIDAGADLAVSSRFTPGGDDTTAPPFRRLLSRGAATVFSRLIAIEDLHDFTCGYRAYRVSLLRRATEYWGDSLVTEQGFACMVELLMKLRHLQPRVVEVPMVLQYDLKQGASKLKLALTLRQYAKLVLREQITPVPDLAARN
ncbi:MULTISPECIES: glycosyltransferase family 2 protein [unclassified Gordonia (in: high G+C Gram-positive bacteria)]|uniref:glycosyltransferase family 2 protein n=1 Tax=unclassified Gordonia (in: high G+C Gram-positive bacteria) TaxID=2657482 RepID=UPI0009EE6620|nr:MULTISPECIES: glycosyltransferase family 2 protein [unclassified Gordonia (in: high G+C Gram-positive bacteria)]